MIIKKMSKFLTFLLLSAIILTQNSLADTKDFNVWLQNFKITAKKEGISKETIKLILSDATYLEKVIVYDGKTIPFSDNSFDTTMVNFILHHTDDPEAILREVIRVSTKYIIIAEDIVDSWFDKYLGLLHAVTYDGIPCKNNFYDSEKWATIFKNLELEIVASKNISRWTWPIYPIHRRIYLLRV